MATKWKCVTPEERAKVERLVALDDECLSHWEVEFKRSMRVLLNKAGVGRLDLTTKQLIALDGILSRAEEFYRNAPIVSVDDDNSEGHTKEESDRDKGKHYPGQKLRQTPEAIREQVRAYVRRQITAELEVSQKHWDEGQCAAHGIPQGFSGKSLHLLAEEELDCGLTREAAWKYIIETSI